MYSCEFLHLFLPTILPSYFHLELSYFQNCSFIILHFHILYIPHFQSSWSFFRFFFSNGLSSGFPTLFLSISFQLSSLSVGHHIFPIPGELFHSFFLPRVTFPVFLSSRLFLCIFPIRCHLFYSCHVHELSNFKFSPCVFFLCFSFFSFHSSFPLSPNFRTVS